MAKMADLMLVAIMLVLAVTEVRDRVPLPGIAYFQSQRLADSAEAPCAAEMLINDAWLPCEVLAWARHHWRWDVRVRFPNGDMGWHKYDRRLIRPAALSTWDARHWPGP